MWEFEINGVCGRKVKETKGPYSAILNLKIVNGVPHVEGFLSTLPITREDIRELEMYLMSLGHTKYITSTFVDGERVTKENTLGG